MKHVSYPAPDVTSALQFNAGRLQRLLLPPPSQLISLKPINLMNTPAADDDRDVAVDDIVDDSVDNEIEPFYKTLMLLQSSIYESLRGQHDHALMHG